MKIGLLGFGTVGRGVYDLVKNQDGITVCKVLCRREMTLPDAAVTHDFNDILFDSGIDTVVEVMGGLHPAYEYVRAALESGKHVVTANKALMAAYFTELVTLAAEKGVSLRCTAAVGGGIGWLTALERVRRAEPVSKIWGIMNGTCNFILDSMTRLGYDYAEILKIAQQLGYAEADPAADVDGIDTRNKLIVSAGIAFGAELQGEVPTAGIRNISAQDIAALAAHEKVCRLIGYCDGENAFVQPTAFPAASSEAAVPQNYNLISLESAALGRQSFFGQGAGRYPTAMNVVQDCFDICQGKTFYISPAGTFTASNTKKLRFYVRGAEIPAEMISEKWDCGVVTCPTPVGQFHEMMKSIDGVFFAALESEENE